MLEEGSMKVYIKNKIITLGGSSSVVNEKKSQFYM